MILRIEDLKDVSSKILAALDTKENVTTVTETLELKTDGRYLDMLIANNEYTAKVRLDMKEEGELHATVKADTFLELIKNTTSDTMDFTCDEKSLKVKGNGKYTFPLTFDGDSLLEIPYIPMGEVTSTFDIPSEVLIGIDTFNSKELSKENVIKDKLNPAQKRYYLDENGCITFTNGACVNNFTLPESVKLMLPEKLVKLFKLFKKGDVHFELGHDTTPDGNVYSKVKFDDGITEIIYKLPVGEDALFSKVPVNAIRGRADKVYPHSVLLNRSSLLNTIKRLSIFMKPLTKKYAHFTFNSDNVEVSDWHKDNAEVIYYDNDTTNISEPYNADIDFADIKAALEGSSDMHVKIDFGDNEAIVITNDKVYSVIPEIRV